MSFLKAIQKAPLTLNQWADEVIYRKLSTIVAPRSTKLRELINSPNTEFIMEAHSGLSAKIAEEADYQADKDFVVVARVEAFIAGWGLDEALRRAEAYRNAGADAILMHSKKSDPSDIEAFMKAWRNQGPVIVVPTKFYNTPTKHLKDLGISMVIWANHNLRASTKAMQDTSTRIFKEQSLVSTEPEVVPVKEIFRLQRDDELKNAEAKYLPKI